MNIVSMPELLGKSEKTCAKYFAARGYVVGSYEPSTMEATLNHAGICVRWAEMAFSPKGRCVSATLHIPD